VNKVYAPGTPCEECLSHSQPPPNTAEWLATAEDDGADALPVCDYCADVLSDPEYMASYGYAIVYRIEPLPLFSEAAMVRAHGDVERAREAPDAGVFI
jgi:hypothetical protein